MRFNPSKCAIMRCTKSHNPFNTSYSLRGSILSVVHKHLYLGVTLDYHLSWSTHITNITNKATKMLNFNKHHLCKCSADTKATAYLLMIQPVMEYACVVWDLHYQTQVLMLENVPRHVARWILSDYSYQVVLMLYFTN